MLFLQRKNLVLSLLVLLVLCEGLLSHFRDNRNRAAKIDDFLPKIELQNIKKIHTFHDTFKWQRSKYMLNAHMNLFYDDVSHARYYANLFDSEYDNFLDQATKEAKNSNFNKLKLLGVNAIVHNLPLSGVLETQFLGQHRNKYGLHRYFLSKISEKSKQVWYKKGDDFNAVQDVKWLSKTSRLWHFRIEIRDATQELVVFRNHFKGFRVYIDEKLVSVEKYYSFYHIKNLSKGEHDIKIRFSWLELLLK